MLFRVYRTSDSVCWTLCFMSSERLSACMLVHLVDFCDRLCEMVLSHSGFVCVMPRLLMFCVLLVGMCGCGGGQKGHG